MFFILCIKFQVSQKQEKFAEVGRTTKKKKKKLNGPALC